MPLVLACPLRLGDRNVDELGLDGHRHNAACRRAELLVRGASKLALLCKISPLVVGLTVVAFGTSAPELAVSIASTLKGDAAIAIGNVVGSNIFNVLFILACQH